MKKSHLLGMEVFYEDKPDPDKCLAGTVGCKGPEVKIKWTWGDTTDESYYDDDDCVEEYEDEVEEVDKLTGENCFYPVTGRIYKVDKLNVVAKFVETKPRGRDKLRLYEMAFHKKIFYVNEGDLVFASDEEVAQYLEESDYNNT